jgi:hypothetical protein
VTLTVEASNATAYQWRINGNNVSEGTGGTTASYTAAVTANATYTVVVGNAGACSITSDNAMLSLTATGCADTFIHCEGFTKISPVETEGYLLRQETYEFCNAKDNASGWRLPTGSELACIYDKRNLLAAPLSMSAYGGRDENQGTWRTLIMSNGKVYVWSNADSKSNFRCVK